MDRFDTTGAGWEPATDRKEISNSILAYRQSPKLPPYTKHLQPLPEPNRALIIYTGSGAWNAAKLELGYAGYFVILPFGDDPTLYRWGFVRGSDVLILGFGESEPIDTIAQLGGLLHLAGAMLVIYSPEHGPVIRINARHKEVSNELRL